MKPALSIFRRGCNGEAVSPIFLTAAIILLDQLTKWLIVSLVPYHTVARSFGGDFLRIIHTRNLAVAFSLGNGFPQPVKLFLFILVPLIALVAISVYLVKGRDLSSFQRWVLAAIVGGGRGISLIGFFVPRGLSILSMLNFMDFSGSIVGLPLMSQILRLW